MRRAVVALLVCFGLGCQPKPSSSDAVPPTTPVPPVGNPASTSMMDKAGVPVYPGAKQLGMASGKPDASGGTHFNALYSLPDPPQRVAAFYREKLKFEATSKGASVMLVGKTSAGSDLLMFIDPEGKGSKLSIKGILYGKE